MRNTRQTTWDDWSGAPVIDKHGDKLGTLGSVYLDEGTGQPEWLGVRTGLFGVNETCVPLHEVEAAGDRLQVPYEKDFVKEAPNVDPDHGFVDAAQEEELYRFYGRDYAAAGHESAVDTGRGRERGRSSDDAMTRSEEEVAARTRSVERGKVRLRKYVVTENVSMTVPVRRERARIEREPITEANRDEALSGPDIRESEHEITLHEEVPVVEKRTVPKERVRLKKEVDAGEEEISEEVRKERIEAEGDIRRR